MECTIGWIKTNSGFILFKNRDTKKKYLKTNKIQEDKYLAKVGYKDNRKGCWIAVNKYGVGFTSAKGPFREIPEGYESWIKFNEIGEIVLKESKSLEEAITNFIELYKKYKVGESANILLCDKNQAYLMELCCGKIKSRRYSRFVFRTNHFEFMKQYNQYLSGLSSSVLRLQKFKDLFKDLKSPDGKKLIPLLTFYSQNNAESICRRGKIMTVGSVVFEITPKLLFCYYSLNKSPCAGRYNERIISWNPLFNKVRDFVEKNFIKAGLRNEIRHLERTVYWVLQLNPNANWSLLISAMSHDIERAFRRKGTLKKIKLKGFIDKEFYETHQRKGAEIICGFLRKEGASDKLIKDVMYLVSHHETGGNKQANILKDADSISFFENNAKFFIGKYRSFFDKQLIKDKLRWMYERTSYKKSRHIIKQNFREYLKFF
jgi:hypothetical protein